MSFVGMDIDRCSQLKANLDQAAADLNAHAANVESALAQAGIQSCQAPAEIRDVAAWAAYRARDLQKRIDRMIAANGGSGPGFRFASPAISKKAANADADNLKTLMKGGDGVGVADALAKVKPYAGDPVYAAALLHALGVQKLLELLRGCVDGDAGVQLPAEVLVTLAALLATVSRANPDDKVVKQVLDQASPAELAALLKFGGFGSAFVARAAVTILKYAPTSAGPMDKKLADARKVALDALKADHAAAKLFFKDADDLAIMSLLRDPDASHVALISQGDLERMLKLVAKDGEISPAAKEALAKLLVPAFLDDRVVGTEVNEEPKLNLVRDETHNELRDVLAILMSDDTARRTIFDAAGAALAKHVAHAVPDMLARLSDPDVTSANPDAYLGGRLTRLVQGAYAQMLGTDAKNKEAEAEILKAAGQVIGGLILKGAPPGVDATANYVMDHVIDEDADAAFARLSAAGDTGPVAESDTQILVAVAEVLAEDPGYRASLQQVGLISADGHLISIKSYSAQEEALKRWFQNHPDLQRKAFDLLQSFENWEK